MRPQCVRMRPHQPERFRSPTDMPAARCRSRAGLRSCGPRLASSRPRRTGTTGIALPSEAPKDRGRAGERVESNPAPHPVVRMSSSSTRSAPCTGHDGSIPCPRRTCDLTRCPGMFLCVGTIRPYGKPRMAPTFAPGMRPLGLCRRAFSFDILAGSNTRLAPNGAYRQMATRETAHSMAQGSGARQPPTRGCFVFRSQTFHIARSATLEKPPPEGEQCEGHQHGFRHEISAGLR